MILRTAMAVMTLLMMGGVAQACPNPALDPLYDSITLTEGFNPNPHSQYIEVGGDNRIDKCMNTSIQGSVATNPDYFLYYDSSGNSTLTVFLQTSTDSVLLVVTPWDEWLIDDDSAGNRDASITIANAPSGWYAIWGGSYGGGVGQPGDLFFTETTNVAAQPQSTCPDPSLEATYGTILLDEGFNPDPHSENIEAGGQNRMDLCMNTSIQATVATNPDYLLAYETSGNSTLTLFVQTPTDSVLLVVTPWDEWLIDDDSAGNSDGLISIPNATAGWYSIWVGAYGTGQPGTLFISERN
jgi:hypothetical protein